MVASKQWIIEQIYEDWGESPQSEICIAVLNYLLSVPVHTLQHITYGSLRIVVGSQYSNQDMLKAIQYLCGDCINLLEAKFELIENDNDIFELSNDEVSLAKETGKLFHPETGELVSNFKEKVFMYFKPTSIVQLLPTKNVNR
jgi:hypothetical protein